ncbi:peptidase [Cytophagaceae bacterium ABcell3]|nr:peptidase [Cytophagaceae bacterium ABcell3]
MINWFKISKHACVVMFLVLTISSCKKEDPSASNSLKVGASARDLLSSSRYQHLEVEIQYVRGFAPTSEAIKNLRDFLQKRLHKPSGITFKYTSINSPNKQNYSVADFREIENQHRTVYTRKDTIGVYFFFADGGYVRDTDRSKVLGVAYQNTSMALFEKTIMDYSDGLNKPSRSTLETVVLNHEIGHNLGLVNLGSPMQNLHQDDEHGHHCDNRSCLMYYTVETTDVISNLLIGGAIPELDQECINDLRANGGK